MTSSSAAVPVPLARAFLSLLPGPVLARLLEALLGKMAQRRPKLFANLARLSPAVLLIAPSDVPHAFLLHVGIETPFISLAEADHEEPKAVIRASLDRLIDMLEGRSDGDTLFFARDITLTGDTEAIVALRNTLDREEIVLMDDVTALAGPFAGPARRVLEGLGHLADAVHNRASVLHQRLHETADVKAGKGAL